MRRAFSLIEVLVSVGLLSLIFGLAILPLRRNQTLATGNVQAVAALVASELRNARTQAISIGIPTGVVIPSQNGSLNHSQSLYLAQGFLPASTPRDPALPPEPSARILRVIQYAQEYPNVFLFSGTWNVDPAQLNVPSATPAIGGLSTLSLEDWIKPTSQDYQYVFLPDGSLVTNDLCHFDGAFHLVVCANLASSPGAPPPGTARMTTNPAYAELSASHRAYTIRISQQGAVSIHNEVLAASGLSDCGPGSPPSSAAPPTLPIVTNSAPLVADVLVSPAPNPNTAAGFDAIVHPSGYLLLTMRIVDPEGNPVTVEWTSTPRGAGGNGVFTSPGGQQSVEYDTDQGCWVARFTWLPPINAAHGDQFDLTAIITDSEGATATVSGSAAISVEARITGNYFFHDNGWICSVDGDGTSIQQVISGVVDPEVSPDGSRIVYQSGAGIGICNRDGSNPQMLTGPGCYSASWSPDGLYLAYQDDNTHELKFMRIHDLAVSTITIPDGVSPSWSRQGKLAFIKEDKLQLADLSIASLFTTPAPLTPTPIDFTGTGVGLIPYAPTWSDDGQHLVFLHHQAGEARIYTCQASASEPVERYVVSGEDLERAWLMPQGPTTRLAFIQRAGAGAGALKLGDINLTGTGLLSNVFDLAQLTKPKGRVSWGP